MAKRIMLSFNVQPRTESLHTIDQKGHWYKELRLSKHNLLEKLEGQGVAG